MEYTTHFGLQSQATRLFEGGSYVPVDRTTYGIVTLRDAPFQRTYVRADIEATSTNYNSPKRF
jgi:hypothetical protein